MKKVGIFVVGLLVNLNVCRASVDTLPALQSVFTNQAFVTMHQRLIGSGLSLKYIEYDSPDQFDPAAVSLKLKYWNRQSLDCKYVTAFLMSNKPNEILSLNEEDCN